MPDVIRVNSTVYSWTSSAMSIAGQPWVGAVAVDYEQKRERKIVHAMRQDGTPLGWTAGKYSVPTFKLKFLKDSALAFKQTLAALGAGSYGDAEWPFTLQCVEPVIGSIPISLVAVPCAVVGARETREEGFDQLVEEFDIATLAMIENGLPLWSIVRSIGV